MLIHRSIYPKHLNMEAYKGTFVQRRNLDEMFEKVTGNVCAGVNGGGECLEKSTVTLLDDGRDSCAAEYGAELNMELKRRLKRQCLFASNVF